MLVRVCVSCFATKPVDDAKALIAPTVQLMRAVGEKRGGIVLVIPGSNPFWEDSTVIASIAAHKLSVSNVNCCALGCLLYTSPSPRDS